MSIRSESKRKCLNANLSSATAAAGEMPFYLRTPEICNEREFCRQMFQKMYVNAKMKVFLTSAEGSLYAEDIQRK